jgi:hypothetical protein
MNGRVLALRNSPKLQPIRHPRNRPQHSSAGVKPTTQQYQGFGAVRFRAGKILCCHLATRWPLKHYRSMFWTCATDLPDRTPWGKTIDLPHLAPLLAPSCPTPCPNVCPTHLRGNLKASPHGHLRAICGLPRKSAPQVCPIAVSKKKAPPEARETLFCI